MLDIQPIKDDGLTSCADIQLEAFGIWKKVGYELMYLDNWKFVFKEEGAENEGIWNRGKIAPRLYFEDTLNTRGLFEKFHGVRLDALGLDITQFERKVDGILFGQEFPVLVFFDTYYLPWIERNYYKIHSRHTIMVIGKYKGGYYFNDTRPFLLEPIYGGALDWEHITNGFNRGIGCFSLQTTCYEFGDIKAQLMSIDLNMFSSMRNFSLFLRECVIESEDMQNEKGEYGNLLRAFRNILKSRVHFQKALKAINQQYSFVKIDAIIDAFYLIIEKWSMIKNLLYKSYISNLYNCYNSKISVLIEECADLEEKNAELLMKQLDKII